MDTWLMASVLGVCIVVLAVSWWRVHKQVEEDRRKLEERRAATAAKRSASAKAAHLKKTDPEAHARMLKRQEELRNAVKDGEYGIH